MRTLTTQQSAWLAATDRTVAVRVYVEDYSAAMTNVADLYGEDWTIAVSLSESVDNPIATAQVQLFRETYDRSMAPLKTASVLNQPGKFLEVGRSIQIKTAVIGEGKPADADFVLMFDGEIDEIDWGGSDSVISLSCRDMGGKLQDTFIESQTRYPAGTFGTTDDVQDLMQEILTEWVASPPTLYTPSSPSWVITQYLQSKEPVMSALQKLAQMIGWDVRYRWDNGTSAFRLTFFQPDRSSPAVDYTIGPSMYDTIDSVKVSRANIRNAINVVYTLASTGVRTIKSVTDAASITRYGRRFMEVAEASTSQIDTNTEATLMANAMLSDLAEPAIDHAVTMDYFWPVQLGDYYTFTANDVHYDTDQSLAVIGYSHAIGPQGAKTTLQTRGIPSTGVKRWLQIEARPGVAPQPDQVGPHMGGATGDPSADVGSIIVSYDAPADSDWAYSEIYLDTSTIASPTYPTKPNQAYLRAVGRQTRFEVGGLVPGETYEGLIIVIDTKGNWDANSLIAFTATATKMVGPYHMNPDSEFGSMLPNPTFGIYTLPKTTTPPDFWNVGNIVLDSAPQTSWASSGTKTMYYDETVFLTGGRSIRKNTESPTGSPKQSRLESDFIVIEYGAVYRADWAWRWNLTAGTAANLAGSTWALYLEFYDSSYSQLSNITFNHTIYSYGTTVFSSGAQPQDTWLGDRGWRQVTNANAKYAKVIALFTVDSGSSADYEMWLDRVNFRRSLEECLITTPTSNAATATWTTVNLTSAVINTTSSYVTATDVWTCPYSGVYKIHGRVIFSGTAGGDIVTTRVQDTLAGTTMASGSVITVGTGGGDDASEVLYSGYIAAGATVELQAWQNSGANRNFSTGTGDCLLTIQQRTGEE